MCSSPVVGRRETFRNVLSGDGWFKKLSSWFFFIFKISTKAIDFVNRNNQKILLF